MTCDFDGTGTGYLVRSTAQRYNTPPHYLHRLDLAFLYTWFILTACLQDNIPPRGWF